MIHQAAAFPRSAIRLRDKAARRVFSRVEADKRGLNSPRGKEHLSRCIDRRAGKIDARSLDADTWLPEGKIASPITTTT